MSGSTQSGAFTGSTLSASRRCVTRCDEMWGASRRSQSNGGNGHDDSTVARPVRMKLVDRRLFIDAAPARVYELLTDAELLTRWMAPSATVDARPGGAITWTHVNGDSVVGAYVELMPDRRIVFTYGWDREDVNIPPGSTTVEIDLRPSGEGTDLHLSTAGSSEPMADAHTGGWANYLARLAAVAEGRDPGPDALAGQRVPSAQADPA